MQQQDVRIPDADRKLVHLKDRSRKAKPGKFSARAKADRPVDKLALVKAQRCKKKKITSIDIAKEIVSSARWARAKAAAEGRTSKRREDRWYICTNCSHGKTSIIHVASISEDEYNAKFEASKRLEFTLAS